MDNQTRTQKLNTAFLQACREGLLKSRIYISDYYKKNTAYLTESLHSALEQGLEHVHIFQGQGKKDSLRYLQFSFLMSGQFSGEHLLKIDFYDHRFYVDPWDVDCFWDYQCLFPEQQKQINQILFHVRNEMKRLLDYELYERLPSFRLGQMQLLQELLYKILKEKRIMSLLSTEANPQIKVIYGTYMGDAQRMFTVQKELL